MPDYPTARAHLWHSAR